MVQTEIGRNGGWLANFIFKVMGKSPEKGAETLLFLMNTSSEGLVSGEYYVNNKVKKITKESYDLVLAEKLMATTKSYLAPFLYEPSVVYDISKS